MRTKRSWRTFRTISRCRACRAGFVLFPSHSLLRTDARNGNSTSTLLPQPVSSASATSSEKEESRRLGADANSASISSTTCSYSLRRRKEQGRSFTATCVFPNLFLAPCPPRVHALSTFHSPSLWKSAPCASTLDTMPTLLSPTEASRFGSRPTILEQRRSGLGILSRRGGHVWRQCRTRGGDRSLRRRCRGKPSGLSRFLLLRLFLLSFLVHSLE
jgi:hypothetical protein